MQNFILSGKKTKIVRYDMNAYITGVFAMCFLIRVQLS